MDVRRIGTSFPECPSCSSADIPGAADRQQDVVGKCHIGGGDEPPHRSSRFWKSPVPFDIAGMYNRNGAESGIVCFVGGPKTSTPIDCIFSAVETVSPFRI